jgi:hypothetical protein
MTALAPTYVKLKKSNAFFHICKWFSFEQAEAGEGVEGKEGRSHQPDGAGTEEKDGRGKPRGLRLKMKFNLRFCSKIFFFFAKKFLKIYAKIITLTRNYSKKTFSKARNVKYTKRQQF